MDINQQQNQLRQSLIESSAGGTQRQSTRMLEISTANQRNESSVEVNQQIMEEVVGTENLRKACKKVIANKGAPGVDGMSVEQLTPFLKQHWPALKERLLQGRYQPQPVKRVDIPKPDGGVRQLGIPTVLDRFIQQALLQVLDKRYDPTFSESSYGFRPKRSAHQAIKQAQAYICSGYGIVVDIDLEQFFDRVNHDRLMTSLAKRITDKRVLKLIRRYLNAGVMHEGLVKPSNEGTPQGGPLSPLLSNVEKCRLSDGQRLVLYLTIMSIIAWRLYWLTLVARAHPDAPCSLVLEKNEWQVLHKKLHPKENILKHPPSVRDAVRWMAQLAGFLARKGDGEPGPIALWRGWKRLCDLAEGYNFVTS